MIYRLATSFANFFVIFIVVITFCTAALAGATNDLINRETKRRDEIVKDVLEQNNGFLKQREESGKKIFGCQQIIGNIKAQHANKFKKIGLSNFAKPVPQALIFVSLSMPDSSLKQIIRDAEHYHIPVVIRGLYENSFRKTFERIFDLVKEKNKGGILINPNWFREYEIQSVPAFVINANNVAGNVTEENKKIDIVYGNIPIKRALSLVAERGENAGVAKVILKKGNR